MERLDDSARAALRTDLPAWSLEGEVIRRTFDLKNFVASIGFVTQVALLAEKADHHPDIDIRWNRVTLTLTTHDAGGLTWRDVELAGAIDRLI